MKLNQVIAIEKSIKQKSYDVTKLLDSAFKKSGLFEGFVKTYESTSDQYDEAVPDERAHVQVNAGEALREAVEEWTRFFDVTAQRDEGNLMAKADVVDDNGVTIIEGAPATFLLFVEKQLVDLHTLISRAPVLDAAEIWKKNEQDGLHRSEETEKTRTKKVQRALVLHPPTDKHPAQTQLITEDVAVGKWKHTRVSGALPLSEKKLLLRKIVNLQTAVKKAREEANGVEAPKADYGRKLFSYIFGE